MTTTSRKQRILVVDDEPSIVDSVATSLRDEGFDVEQASNGRHALQAAQERTPDLIALDVMLPDLDGLEVTRRLRSDGLRVPVLFLTARDALEDKIAGLTVGGDDYVTKPFALVEVIARVHAILRRSGVESEEDGILRFADLELDENSHEVTRAGHPIRLTATEFNLSATTPASGAIPTAGPSSGPGGAFGRLGGGFPGGFAGRPPFVPGAVPPAGSLHREASAPGPGRRSARGSRVPPSAARPGALAVQAARQRCRRAAGEAPGAC